MITGSGDPEDEVRAKLHLLKKEFLRRYKLESYEWTSNMKKLKEFNKFTEKYIFIPPKILLIGEDGVGKTSMLDLFPGETILELDDDMNEVIQKKVSVSSFPSFSEVLIQEINSDDIIQNSKIYKPLLDSTDIICIVTNSGSGNLSRTKNMYSRLKGKVKKAVFYIIANFQDQKNSAFEPERISESFGLKTFGFSAINERAKDRINEIINNIIEITFSEKIEGEQKVE
jgi:GTPase SAR1 family protein